MSEGSNNAAMVLGAPMAEVKRKAGELRQAAASLEEQLLLSEDEPAFEESFFLPPEELRKRYTGEHARQIEWRREAALYMVGRQCPVEDVARLLHMNKRLVAALCAENGRKVAMFSDRYADELLSSAASDFALAETKRTEASYLQLVTGGGIKTDKAMAVKLMAGGAVETEGAIDLEAENPALQAARAFLEARRKAEVVA